MATIFSGSICCIITGASRGFGRAVSVKFAEEIDKSGCNADFHLLARSKDGLEETAKSINQISKNTQVHTIAFDISNMAALPTNFAKLAGIIQAEKYDNAILINVAGTMDLVKCIVDIDNIEETTKFISTNFVSYQFITTKFMQHFKDTRSQIHIISLSSIAAKKPYKSWGIPCCTKAARNMLMEVIAKENPNITAINYEPGVMDTKLVRDLCATTMDNDLRNWLGEQIQNNTTVDPLVSATRLIGILKARKFTNGSYVSYDDDDLQ